MPTDEHSESSRSRYDRCDPHYLRDLRQAAGMEVEALARTACLSVAQVRALESDEGDDCFYSHTIRRQAYKRALMILGAEPPSIDVPAGLLDAHQVAEAHLNTLDQIVAMSEQPPMNFTLADRVREGFTVLVDHKQFVGALLFLVAAVVLFVLYGPLKLIPEYKEPTPALAKVEPPPVVEPQPVVSMPAAPASAVVAPLVAPAASVPQLVPAPIPASAPAPAPVAATSATAVAAAVSTLTTCVFSSEALPQVLPFVARKEGTYVYLVSSAATDICVVDGNKNATTLQLKAGESRTIAGIAPWQISGANLQSIQIYFQGGRVTIPAEASRRFKLVEQPIAR